MALDRFKNIDEIVQNSGKTKGIVWKAEDIDLLALDVKTVKPIDTPTVELHMYTPGDNSKYVAGGTVDADLDGSKIYINHAAAAESFGIQRGQFEAVVNIHKNLIGAEENQVLYIDEISDDRRELHIKAKADADVDISTYIDNIGGGSYASPIYETSIDAAGNEIQVFDDNGDPVVKAYESIPISEDIALNFGQNQIYKVINQKEWNEENDFVVRLYDPLPESILEKNYLWVVEQLSDSYIDNVNIIGPSASSLHGNQLKGPNFDIDTSYSTVTETNFRNWNQLLDANLSTSQQIIDQYFSGSLGGVDLGIDYTNFEKFIHFSSAKERLANFKEKLSQLEYYDERLVILDAASGTDSSSLQGNIAVTQRRRDQVVGSFDGFEKWLYNEPTSSLFTHGISGSFVGAQGYSVTPFPKYLSGSKYYLHGITSSRAENWYNGFSATASLYDLQNESALAKSIPEHIRLDSNNDQYELFVNMIGHHYDIIYSYIDNLTRIYKPEEHFKLGQSKDVLYDVAKSLGWTLTNGKQASQLWQYKLGVDSGSGEYQTTGSLFSKSDEQITTEVWRRIVNNLPHLLKIKGTARSVKTLMNTYGIPQTLLSIREYGGPKVGGDQPLLIEDRFTYALHFNSGSELIFPNVYYSASIDEWGIAEQAQGGGSIPQGIPIKNHEFRFRPATTSSMHLISAQRNLGGNLGDYAPSQDNGARTHAWTVAIQHTGSYSGSTKYGRLHFAIGVGGNAKCASASMTEWLPLYDGNFWNCSVGFITDAFITMSTDGLTTPGVIDHHNTGSNTTTTYQVHCQQASDYITDKIVHSGSLKVKPTETGHHQNWSEHRANQIGSTFPHNYEISSSINLGGFSASLDIFSVQEAISASFEKTTHPGNTISVSTSSVSREFVGNPGASPKSPSTHVIGSFTGSMQEYRSWLEYFSDTTFDLHTLNPTSYVSEISPSSSYDTLIRHYPLGTDLNAVDHNAATGYFISSSHPNQSIQDFSSMGNANTQATMSNFKAPTNVQRGNYVPIEETYYVQGVSLGSNLPRSQKIRLEDNELVRPLSPRTSAERSRFDRAPIDTNRLGLFYSHADQVNKEIFNHIGDVELDDFIGDPDDEFEFIYDDLEDFSKGYWKKYTDRNDINAFIRVFSQFDFALFRQIKQLLPERVDEAMGLIIEPNALERNKYRLTRRIGNEPLHYRGHIVPEWYSASADIQPLSGTIEKPVSIDMQQVYNISASGYTEIPGNLVLNVQTIPTGSSDYCTIEINTFDNQDTNEDGKLMQARATASLLQMYQVLRTQAHNAGLINHFWTGSIHVTTGDAATAGAFSPHGGNIRFLASGSINLKGKMQGPTTLGKASTNALRIQFDTYNRFDTIRDFTVDIDHSLASSNTNLILRTRLITTKNNFHAEKSEYFVNDSFSQVHIISSSLGDGVDYLDGIAATNNVTEMSSAEIDRSLAYREDEIDFTSLANNTHRTSRISFTNIKVPARTNLTLELVYESSANSIRTPRIHRLDIIQAIKKVCHSVHQVQVTKCRESDIYKKVINHFGTGSRTSKIGKDHERFISQSLGLYFSQSLAVADYMDDFFVQTENQRYNGCTLGGPGINQETGISAIDNKPVIEVYSVNPNQLIYTDQPATGNPGNLIVR